jgi:hypothetical protein
MQSLENHLVEPKLSIVDAEVWKPCSTARHMPLVQSWLVRTIYEAYSTCRVFNIDTCDFPTGPRGTSATCHTHNAWLKSGPFSSWATSLYGRLGKMISTWVRLSEVRPANLKICLKGKYWEETSWSQALFQNIMLTHLRKRMRSILNRKRAIAHTLFWKANHAINIRRVRALLVRQLR